MAGTFGAVRPPLSFWVVAGLSLLWNGFGAYLYTLTNLGDAALRAYIEQGDLRTRHGAAGEARAMEFSWDRINQAVADTYLRLIRQRAGARRQG